MKFIQSLKLLVILSFSIFGTAIAQGIKDLTPTEAYCCFKKLPTLDTEQFGIDIHEQLRHTGYVMELRKRGVTIHQQYWGWSYLGEEVENRPSAFGPDAWDTHDRMHISGVSGLITSIGFHKMLNDWNTSHHPFAAIGLETKIIDYLPSHWVKGPNIDKITFRQLLTHTSGFTSELQLPYVGNVKFPDEMSYSIMKTMVGHGVSFSKNGSLGIGKYHPQNINYSLFRIIMPYFLHKNAIDNGHDSLIDLSTQTLFKQYINQNVFNLAALNNTGNISRRYTSGISYTYTLGEASGGVKNPNLYNNVTGWNSGNLSQAVGSIGWHLSVDDLLEIMHTFRREGKYIPSQQAATMLDNGFGLNGKEYSKAGSLYSNYGYWEKTNGSISTHYKEQAIAYFLPNDMELVVFVNSRIGLYDKSLREIVTNAYINNLK